VHCKEHTVKFSVEIVLKGASAMLTATGQSS